MRKYLYDVWMKEIDLECKQLCKKTKQTINLVYKSLQSQN